MIRKGQGPFRGEAPPRLVVGMTGSERVAVGVRLLEILQRIGVETHLVMGERARRAAVRATGLDGNRIDALSARAYRPDNQAARISSGSFLTRGMIIAPCSSRALAAITRGMSNNLIYRAADVTIKEGRRLVVFLGEAPGSPAALESVARASGIVSVVSPGHAVGSPEEEGAAGLDGTVAHLLELVGIDDGWDRVSGADGGE